MKRRLPKLARWIAGIYLIFGLVVFFGSLGSDSHSWWPIFLYPVIWPLSFGFQLGSSLLMDAVFPDQTPAWAYVAYDYVAAFFYIGVGSVWVWCLGRIFSIVVTRIFPLKVDKIVA
jgi:hypothetical protein